MTKLYKQQFTVGSLLLALLFTIPDTHAQNLWMADTANSISLNFLKPSLNRNNNLSFFSGSYILSSKLNLSKKRGKKYILNMQLPLAYAKPDDDIFNATSETALGNFLFSIDFWSVDNAVSYEFGAMLPTASDDNFDAVFIGLASNPLRVESYVTDFIYIYNGLNYRKKLDENLNFKFRTGLSYFQDTGEDVEESEAFIDYGFQIRYNGGLIALQLGLEGRWWATPGDIEDPDRFSHQFVTSIKYGKSKFKPGISIILPASDDLSSLIDSVVGINVTYQIP